MSVMEATETKVLEEQIDGLKDKIVDHESTIRELREEIEDLGSAHAKEIDDLEAANGAAREEIQVQCEDKIQALLDLVERPVGKFQYTVAPSARLDRAIVDLFDAVGRNP